MSKIGEIFLNLKLNQDEFNREVSKLPAKAKNVGNDISSSFSNTAKKMQGDMNTAGNKISGILGKLGQACAAAFSIAAITSFVKVLTESAAQVQAANSQFEQTFGSLSGTATEAIKKVADESGIVQSRLQGVGTSIYGFAKTSGMDSASAMTLMQEALQVTADSAAYYDRSLEDTAESLKAFLKGNYANDAALGLSCTETTRNAAANKLYGKSFKDLTEAQKQMTLLQMVKDANAASGALGQAARESDGLENVLGNLKETWNQFLAIVGKPVLKVAVVVIQTLTKALTRLMEVAKLAVGELGKLFGWEMEESSSGAQETAEAISDSVDNQEELTQEVKKTNKEVKRGVASFDRLNIISQSGGESDDSDASDSGSGDSDAAEAVAPLVAFEQKADETTESVLDKFKSTFENLYKESGFKSFVDNMQKGINSVNWGAIKSNFAGIFESLKPIAKEAFEQLKQVGSSALGAIGSTIGTIVAINGKSLQTISGGIDKWLKRDKNKITNHINSIGNNLTAGFQNWSSLCDGIIDVVGGSIDRMRFVAEDSISDLLSGMTDLLGGIGEVLTGAFAEGTAALSDWIHTDGEEIGLFFDNLQLVATDTFTLMGGMMSDFGTTLSEWWNSEGAVIFRSVCDMITNIGTTLMNVWNDWIMPVWNLVKGIATSAWNDCLSPIFKQIISILGKLGNLIAILWNRYLSPLVNFMVDTFGPIISKVLQAIEFVFTTVFRVIGGVISNLLSALGGFLDFLTGVFTGDWKKAWNGIKTIFLGIFKAIESAVTTIMNAIWTVIKFVVNKIIGAINALWSGVYAAVSHIVNTIGSIAGALGDLIGFDWHFSIPSEPPLIPKLAKGGIITAPTLALVGDNSGAGNGDPEIVSPLSRLQEMIDTSSGYDVVLLKSILDYLKQLYQLFILIRNDNRSGSRDPFQIFLDGDQIFDGFVERVNQYKLRHNGALPF